MKGEKKFKYLDLKPNTFRDAKGVLRTSTALKRWGADSCFKETDLYTTVFGLVYNTDIERFFFGRVDNDGKNALEYFEEFEHPSVDGDSFHGLMNYMSIQKFRTPKGLSNLSRYTNILKKNILLLRLQEYQNMHCALWTEGLWSIAENHSDIGFIISDHSVTVYNEDCFPGSLHCIGSNDPEIWQTGTHTIFPLSPKKVLIITNLSWVRNPYSRAFKDRPNPQPFRSAMFNFTDIQTKRILTNDEVLRINYIIKKRAFRYIAAVNEADLYPENFLDSTQWRSLNEKYLLMPDPRSVGFGGETIIGYKGGHSDAFDEYGYKPRQKNFSDRSRREQEWETFLAFQGEYARLYGPNRRGISYQLGRLTRGVDDEDFHKYHLELESRLPSHVKSRSNKRARKT